MTRKRKTRSTPKKKRLTRKESARRIKIRRGVRRYWRRVKKVRKKHSVTLKRARKLVKAGVGRSKKERARDRKKKERRRRPPAKGTLWEGSEYVITFEENQRDNIQVQEKHLTYTAEVSYTNENTDAENPTEYKDEFSWDAKGANEFWGGWWTELKIWMNVMADFFPEAFEVDKSPQAGSVVVTKITFRTPEE